MASENNKRVAKNAVALTIRMALVTVVGLYTSRIVLEALGVDDYGIYGVIGGVVAMASFLNTSMAGATSRFITYEMGTGNTEKLSRIFSTALIIHFIIAGIVAVLAETVGLWFVNTQMNFPSGSMFAVNVLYQFTILTMIVSFTQVPYASEIFAREKMSIYAWLEIGTTVLKLVIVYVLLIVSSNRLILYGALTTVVTVIIALLYRFYCIRNFPESKFKWVWDKALIREMLVFSGYNLYGRACTMAKNQIQPILLNVFFGVIANAASSIALTVSGALQGFASTVTQAFSPQIVKSYAEKNIPQMTALMQRASQFNLLAMAALSVPFYVMAEDILYLWLGQVPQYSVMFFRLIIISLIGEIFINVNYNAIYATGNVKNVSFISGTLYLFIPVISYLFLKAGYLNPGIVYVVNICILMIVAGLSFVFIKKQINDVILNGYLMCVLRTFIATAVPLVGIWLSKNYIHLEQTTWIEKFVCVLITALIYNALLIPSAYFISLSATEKAFCREKIIAFYYRLNVLIKK